VHHTFTMTTAQWHNLPARLKRQKTHRQNIRGKARQWCLQNGVSIGDQGFRDAVDSGRWHFICHVVECVRFDAVVYERLRDEGKESASASAKGSPVIVEEGEGEEVL